MIIARQRHLLIICKKERKKKKRKEKGLRSSYTAIWLVLLFEFIASLLTTPLTLLRKEIKLPWAAVERTKIITKLVSFFKAWYELKADLQRQEASGNKIKMDLYVKTLIFTIGERG